MSVNDDIGSRGEALFFVLITQFCGRQRPLFRPHFLGEKFATLDYLVEVLDTEPTTPFFFVQVKTTAQGYTKGIPHTRRLKVQISQQDMDRLIHYAASPAYQRSFRSTVRHWLCFGKKSRHFGRNAIWRLQTQHLPSRVKRNRL